MTKILELPEGQEVAVIGTLYKEMKLKPSILDEYNKVGPCCQAPTPSLHCPSHVCNSLQIPEPDGDTCTRASPVQHLIDYM